MNILGSSDPSSSSDVDRSDKFHQHAVNLIGTEEFLARLGPTEPVHYRVDVVTELKNMPENIWKSSVRFSDPNQKAIFQRSFTHTSHSDYGVRNSPIPTTQIYTLIDEAPPLWASELVHALTTMGCKQHPFHPDWYKTEGETHWLKTYWPRPT